jgi:hypothetical protein
MLKTLGFRVWARGVLTSETLLQPTAEELASTYIYVVGGCVSVCLPVRTRAWLFTEACVYHTHIHTHTHTRTHARINTHTCAYSAVTHQNTHTHTHTHTHDTDASGGTQGFVEYFTTYTNIPTHTHTTQTRAGPYAGFRGALQCFHGLQPLNPKP